MVFPKPMGFGLCESVLPVVACQVNRNWTGLVSNRIPRPKMNSSFLSRTLLNLLSL